MRYRMNPEACAELIEECGSVSAAARSIAVPRNTFNYWARESYRSRHLSRSRDRYATDPEYRRRQLEKVAKRYANSTYADRSYDLLKKRRKKALVRLSERGNGSHKMNTLGDAMFGNLLTEVEENLNGKI